MTSMKMSEWRGMGPESVPGNGKGVERAVTDIGNGNGEKFGK